jgi:transposase
VTIIQLPHYSPELNPIENLRHYLKRRFWSNRAYAGYDELEQADIDARQQAALDADLMKENGLRRALCPKR